MCGTEKPDAELLDYQPDRAKKMAVQAMTPDEHKMLRAGSIWFPLAMVVSMLLFVATFAWTLSGEKSRIDAKFDRLSDNVSQLSDSVKALALRVSAPPDGSYITKQQWVIMCLEHQILNPNWKCGVSPEIDRMRAQGWSATLDTILR